MPAVGTYVSQTKTDCVSHSKEEFPARATPYVHTPSVGTWTSNRLRAPPTKEAHLEDTGEPLE
eukprot:4244557-Pyramimonas_sp.AAC.1